MHISPRVVVSIRIQLPVPVTSLGTLHRIEKKQYAHSSVCYDSQTVVMAKNKVEWQEFSGRGMWLSCAVPLLPSQSFAVKHGHSAAVLVVSVSLTHCLTWLCARHKPPSMCLVKTDWPVHELALTASVSILVLGNDNNGLVKWWVLLSQSPWPSFFEDPRHIPMPGLSSTQPWRTYSHATHIVMPTTRHCYSQMSNLLAPQTSSECYTCTLCNSAALTIHVVRTFSMKRFDSPCRQIRMQ